MLTPNRVAVLHLEDRAAGVGVVVTPDDDRALAARFRDGDPLAVREVYDRYAGAITTVAMRLLGDRDLAADAVQRTFVKAWRAAASFDADRSLAPWLYAIARRVAIDVWREEHRATRGRTDGEVDVAVTPSTFEHAWEAWEVRVALEHLPVDEREVVRLTHFEGLTHAETAEWLDVPIGTVKSRSHRAHRRLAGHLAHLMEVPR